MAKKTPSRSGANRLKSSNQFNWKRYIPFIAVIMLVGGIFVWRGFAATKLYDYQYSVYQCNDGKFSAAKINPADSCVINSAEAMTYRYYKAALKREPETVNNKKDAKGNAIPSGYAYWTQKFAGDRQQPTELATAFVAASATAKGKTNQAFIEDVYLGVLSKKADTAGLKYWKQQLDSKKWTRGKVVAHFASTDAAKKAMQTSFANFLAKAPRVKITPVAKTNQDVRLLKSTKNANDAEKLYNAMKGYPEQAKNKLKSAKSIASKSVPSSADLKAIAANEKAVRDLATKTNSPRGKLAEYQRQNKLHYENAAKVAAYSPDLSADGVKKQYDRTVVYARMASNANSELTNTIKGIASQYKAAESKYEADQIAKQKAAEEAAKNASRPKGTGSTGGSTGSTGGTGGSVNCDSVPLDQLFNDPELAKKCFSDQDLNQDAR